MKVPTSEAGNGGGRLRPPGVALPRRAGRNLGGHHNQWDVSPASRAGLLKSRGAMGARADEKT